MTPLYLDVAAAAARHRADTAAVRAMPNVLHVSTWRDTRAVGRNRPFCVTVKVGRTVRVSRFATEREQALYAAQARADVALLAEHIHDHAKER